MAIDVKNKSCNTCFSRASLNSRISGRLPKPKKYIRIRRWNFFTPFWKYRFWVFNLNLMCMVALLRMKAGVPIVSEYYLPCIVIDVLFSQRSRLPRRRETSSLESELNSTLWVALYTVCSPASMAMAAFIPLCVAAIGSVLFVNWDRHCCIITNRFVWLFCIVSRLYGFVTRYLLIRRTLPWISLRHPSGFPNHPHYLHIGQKHIKDTLIHDSTAQCTWINTTPWSETLHNPWCDYLAQLEWRGYLGIGEYKRCAVQKISSWATYWKVVTRHFAPALDWDSEY